jgi:phosphate transport system substrate-binding protein
MAGITSGIADISFIGRESYRSEIRGFKGRFGYEPLGIEISSGSFGTPHKTFSLEIFTHASNPLKGLTMDQAQAIFGCTGPNGKKIRTWGDLGLTGAIATHPIHVYGYQFDTGMAGYFNRVVLHDSGTWNADLKDFDNGHDANGEVINAGVYILKALAADPDGIAFANLQYANPKIKQIGLAEHVGAPFVMATPDTIWDRSYPLHRFSTLYINRKPGTPVDPKVREFIRYILSREGMQAVADDGAYTPINEQAAQAQRHKLD